MGPYDDLVAALDHAADLFGDRKVVMWCMEWAIARNPDPAVFACAIDESGGVAEDLRGGGIDTAERVRASRDVEAALERRGAK